MLHVRLPLERALTPMAIPPGNIATAALLAASIGPVAYTITSSKVSMPIRLAITRRAVASRDARLRWLSDLLSCPYCVSHWLAFAATLVYRPWLVDSGLPAGLGRPFDFFVTAMAMVAVAMGPVWLIKRALAPVGAPPTDSPPPSPPPGNSDRLNRSAPDRASQRPDQTRADGDGVVRSGYGRPPMPGTGPSRPDVTMDDQDATRTQRL